MTLLVGLIGYPVKHSISAAFQQAAFDHLGMTVQYLLWEVPLQELGAKLEELREPDHLGANITIPHKESVFPLLDHVDEVARRMGAVNTIVNQGGLLIGFNTDAQGFLLALQGEGAFEPRGRKALLLGAGGAARAAAFVLLEQGVGSLAIVNRDVSRAQALARDLERATGGRERGRGDRQRVVRSEGAGVVSVYPWEPEALRRALEGCDLLVNCTPLGTQGSRWEGHLPLEAPLIPPGALVYDLVYNPPETPLLAAARALGARTLSGLPMLLYQGAASFRLWTGRQAPLEIMAAAARRALGIASDNS